MDISARSYALIVTKAADVLGVPLPAGYLEHVNQADALAADVSAIAKVSGDQLTIAAISALEAGRDHHTDDTVQRLLLDRVLASQGIEHTARARANEQLRSTLADCADGILETWADVLDQHAVHLVAAAEAGLKLEKADAAVAKGGEVMHQMHRAQAAVTAWTAAANGFGALAAVAGVSYSGHTAPLILTPARKAELTPAYELAREARTDVDAWVLARCGIPLELATLGDFMARAATFNADREAEDRAEAEARKQRVANTW